MFDPIDEIKAKIDIVDLVSQYVVLKKTGRSFKGLCPFHKEKTPSFIVSPDKQIAYCFGCHKGGDIFRFTMEMDRVEFGEALQKLAKRAGVKLEHRERKDVSYKQKLLAINAKAQSTFSIQLFTQEGKNALEYLRKKRGLSDNDIKTFSLGYALDSYDSLYKELLQEGYEKKEIVDAGVASLKEFSQDSLYDRFRNRIIFPIHNVDDDVVAFGGRVLDDALPKYLNSSDTIVYHKSSILYNLNRAREAIKEKGTVLIVEGYMDALSVYCAGIHNVVAVCGTALTEEQVKLLKRYTSTILFCFDSDEAGVQAMKRNAEPIIKQQLVLKVVPLKEYKDPDEYVQKDKKGFMETLEKPVDFMEFLIDSLQKKYDINTLEGRHTFLSEIFPLLKIFPFAVERDLYIHKVATILQTSPASVLGDLQKVRTYHTKVEEVETKTKKWSLLHYIMGFIISYPSFLPLLQEKIPHITFASDILKSVYNKIQDAYNDNRLSNLIENLSFSQEEKEKMSILQLLVENEFPEMDASAHKKIFLELLNRYSSEMTKKRNSEWVSVLKKEHDKEVHGKMFKEYKTFLDSDQKNS